MLNRAGIRATLDGPRVRSVRDRVVQEIVQDMKRRCPVSPVFTTYAAAVPLGSSRGPVYRGTGKGAWWPGGADVPRWRSPGDLPLRPSGYLRASIRAERAAGGAIRIGTNAGYGKYPNDGTRPHIIESHGPWSLRNRASGQLFGRVVHHPGNRGVHFVEETARAFGGRDYHA